MAAVLTAAQSVLASEGSVCADFLEAQGRKPVGLEYVGCTVEHDAQLRVLVASYKVEGGRAHPIERYLVRHTGMARLRFLCCGWEPLTAAAGGVRRRDGALPRGLEPGDRVTMYSDETLVSRRADWSQIPAFHVRVTRYLESP